MNLEMKRLKLQKQLTKIEERKRDHNITDIEELSIPIFKSKIKKIKQILKSS